MASWWDVFQTVADGISIVPSWLWLIRDRSTVTSPKMVLKVKGRVPLCLDASTGFALPVLENQFSSAFSIRTWKSLALDFETGPTALRLNLVGRCSSCRGMGKVISSASSSAMPGREA